MKLNEINDNKGARKDRTRVGRGIGSGKGKTCGRGIKGYKSRSGSSVNGFEGGQMPIYRRLPKRGFKNPFKKEFTVINLDVIQEAVSAGKVDAAKEINAEVLLKAGVIGKVLDGVRVLARGKVSDKLTIKVAGASKAAVEAVEKAGGKLELISDK